MAPIHPLLKQLKLLSGNENSPSCADVLSHLLDESIVTEEAVRNAHATLLTQKSQKQAESVEKQPNQQYRRRHIALRIYYDGSKYSGLAENVGDPKDQSVERALFQALKKAHLIESRESSKYSRCGRTDRGVSAAGQVIALYLKSVFHPDASLDEAGEDPLMEDALPRNSVDPITVHVPVRAKKKDKAPNSSRAPARMQKLLSEYAYDRILNNLLPPDIRVLGWAPVSVDFSARFSATMRTYKYFFVASTMRYLDRMQEAIQLLQGTHDFRNFCKMDVEKVYNFERKIFHASVEKTKDENVHYLLIHGQAFLWHQIRCIASVLFLIGQGLEDVSVVTELLNVDKYPGKPAYALASDLPLVLHDCGYSALTIGFNAQNLWSVSSQLHAQWQDAVIAAARLQNCMESLQESGAVVPSDLLQFVNTKLSRRQKNLKSGKALLPFDTVRELPERFKEISVIPWKDALQWMRESFEMLCIPEDVGDVAYTPLLERSRGSTYEEKVASLQQSTKRRQKYETNIIKKRKTKEEDGAFYDHMTKQGGSAV